jgi:ribosomal protein S27AE
MDRYRQDSEFRKRYKARQRIAMQVRRGTRAKRPCEQCGSMVKIEAHHEDYDRPNDVRWMCRQCLHD